MVEDTPLLATVEASTIIGPTAAKVIGDFTTTTTKTISSSIICVRTTIEFLSRELIR